MSENLLPTLLPHCSNCGCVLVGHETFDCLNCDKDDVQPVVWAMRQCAWYSPAPMVRSFFGSAPRPYPRDEPPVLPAMAIHG